MGDLTVGDVDQAEAALVDVKHKHAAGDMSREDYNAAKRAAVAVRVAWRQQEEAAGNRTGRIGGDAYASGG